VPDENVWEEELDSHFSGSPRKVNKPRPGGTPKKIPDKKRPQQTAPSFPWVWFLLSLACVIVGLKLYWKDFKIAAVIAAGWFFVAAVVGFARVAYHILLNIWVRLLGRSAKSARGVFLPLVFIFTCIYILRVAPWLPVIDAKIDAAVERKLSNVKPFYIYHSADGVEVFSEGSRLVGADEIWNSPLRLAIIDIEDERFLIRDIPIDPVSIGRALWRNWTTNKREGGSTLQIQITDMLFEDFDNQYVNKFFEWFIALRLDGRMPDRATQLAAYVNLVPGNEDSQGAAALAADLFNVSDLRRLTPAQAATIAAGLKGSDYNPRRNSQKALERRNLVLDVMHRRGDLNEEQYLSALRSELSIADPLKPYEHFVRAFREENSGLVHQALVQRIRPLKAGTIEAINGGRNVSPIAHVRLTLDPGLQVIADNKIAAPLRRMIRKGSLPPDTDVAFVVMENSTGHVLAVIPALKGELDLTRRTSRDPGSIWKPLEAAAALTRRAIFPHERFPDTGPMKFDGAVIHNFGNRYSGQELTIVDCLARSSNVCAMQIQARMSADEWRDALAALNLPLPRSFAKLGIGDNWPVPVIRTASAYTALQNGGEMAMPSYVASVSLADGSSLQAPTVRRRVFDPAACQVVLAGMKACITRGTGTAAKGLRDAAWGKTGTTQDSMAVLQTRRLTMVLWIGNRDSNKDLKKTGGALAMKLLAAFLSEVRKTQPQLAPSN
jgi:membrane peptidoglycan carboxypeptidase